MLGRRWLAVWVPSDSLIKYLTPFEDDTDICLLNFLMYGNSQKILLSRWLHSKLIFTLKFLSRLCTAKFRSSRGASHHPAFMVSSLTINQTCLLCPPWGKMGQQSWTVVAAINQLSNLKLDCSWQYGGYIVELPSLKLRFETRDAYLILCNCHGIGLFKWWGRSWGHV